MAAGAIERLTAYPYKGNVRELENVIKRALIQYDGNPLTVEQFIFKETERENPSPRPKNSLLKLDDAMACHIREALDMADGRINGSGGAAELLGIHPNTLRNRMNNLGIAYGAKCKNR